MSTVPQPIRILIVDDHVIVRAGLRMLLESQPDLLVVGEAGTCADALTLTTREQPDIILLDLDLSGEMALASIPDLLAAAPQARILILTGVRDLELHRQAVRLGALGLVLKDKATEVLLQAITKVQAGEVWLERTMIASVLGEITRARRAPAVDPEVAKIATLTDRERAVITLVGEGLRNKQMADRLAISETTVRHHLTAIFAKLEVTDRLELVIYAYRHGLAKLPR